MKKDMLQKITVLQSKVERFRDGWQAAEVSRIEFGEESTSVDPLEIVGEYNELAAGLAEIRQMLGE